MLPTIKEIRQLSKTNRYGYEYVLDYLANYIVKFSIYLKISPIELSLFWIIIQFISCLFFLKGNYYYSLIGIIIFQLMFVVDLSDGKLFRFYKSGKKYLKPLFPKYLDRFGHFINNPILFLSLGIGLFFRFNTLIYFYFSVASSLFYLLNKALSLNPSWYKSFEERESIASFSYNNDIREGKSLIKKLIFDFLRIEHLGNLLFLLILFDFPHYAVIFYSFIHFIEFMRKIILQGVILINADKKRKKNVLD
jgi:hypothetical protein